MCFVFVEILPVDGSYLVSQLLKDSPGRTRISLESFVNPINSVVMSPRRTALMMSLLPSLLPPLVLNCEANATQRNSYI